MDTPNHSRDRPEWIVPPSDPSLLAALEKSRGDLRDLVSEGGHLVKRGGHRQVWHLRLGPLDAHVKRNQISGVRGHARRFFRGHKALLEAKRLLDLSKAGVPTLEVLGVAAEPGISGASWIVTRTAPGTIPLDKFFAQTGPNLTTSEKKDITHLLARLLASMHQHGYHHTDLHPGNILYSADPMKSLRLLDVHDLKKVRPSWKANLSNLVILNRWFRLRVPKQDRFRFLRSYLAEFANHKPACPWSAKTLARLIEEKTFASTQHLWKGRDIRCLQVNKDFKKISWNCGGITGKGFAASNEFPDIFPELPAPFGKPNQIADESSSRSTVLKQSKSSTVLLFIPEPTGLSNSGGMIIKDIPKKPFPAALVSTHPCKRSWIVGHALRNRFLPTPMPLAWLVFPDGSERLVQREVKNARALDAWWGEVVDPQRRGPLFSKLAKIICHMHESGARHRDLKAANILVDEKDCIWLVDLVGVRLIKEVSAAFRVADLSRLARSALSTQGVRPTEMLVFFRSYLGGKLKPGWKSIARNILRKANQKIDRNNLRGRSNG